MRVLHTVVAAARSPRGHPLPQLLAISLEREAVWLLATGSFAKRLWQGDNGDKEEEKKGRKAEEKCVWGE